MRTSLIIGTVIAALVVANQNARAQGLFGVLESAAATPVHAAQDLAGATTTTVEHGAAAAVHVGTEAVYLAGDGSETVYKYHPGARLGRKAGILPEGKLGLLPSHDRSKPSLDAQASAAATSPHGAGPAREAERSSEEAHPAISGPSPNDAASSDARQKSDPLVARSHRAPARPRRSRGLFSRLFHFGRR